MSQYKVYVTVNAALIAYVNKSWRKKAEQTVNAHGSRRSCHTLKLKSFTPRLKCMDCRFWLYEWHQWYFRELELERKQVLQQEAYPDTWPMLTPKTRPSLALSSQNRRKHVWDVAEPPCKISRRSAQPWLRNR